VAPSAAHPAAPVATVLVRNAAAYDARAFRVAETLRGMGYDTEIVAVVSAFVADPPAAHHGIPVRRLDPRSPLGELVGRRPGTGGERSAGGEAAPRPGRRRATTGALRRLLARPNALLKTLDYYRLALRALRARPPVLLHCNDYPTMWVGVAAHFLLDSRLVYDSHELWPDRNGRQEWRPWLIAAEALFVRVADRCIVTSPGHADAMARRYRIAPPTVVRNVPARAATVVLEPPPGEPTAVYLGGVMPGRGLEQAIAALASVDGLRLRIIGPGRPGYRECLAGLARAQGVAARVSFPPMVPTDRVVEASAGCHLGVALFQPTCRSYVLGLPGKLSEYILGGVPVLASDFPVHAAFLNDLGAGELVDPTDPEAIAEGCRRLLEPDRQREVRARLAQAPERLSWSREREVLEAVYREAAAPQAALQ
jgi:glycosyltransferase involved in cell wall biosynthesis